MFLLLSSSRKLVGTDVSLTDWCMRDFPTSDEALTLVRMFCILHQCDDWHSERLVDEEVARSISYGEMQGECYMLPFLIACNEKETLTIFKSY